MTTKGGVACLAHGVDHVPRDQSEFIKPKMVIEQDLSLSGIPYDEDFAIQNPGERYLLLGAP